MCKQNVNSHKLALASRCSHHNAIAEELDCEFNAATCVMQPCSAGQLCVFVLNQHKLGLDMQIDLSKRYGNLIGGIGDIKGHPWFKTIDWDACLARRMPAPIK